MQDQINQEPFLEDLRISFSPCLFFWVDQRFLSFLSWLFLALIVPHKSSIEKQQQMSEYYEWLLNERTPTQFNQRNLLQIADRGNKAIQNIINSISVILNWNYFKYFEMMNTIHNYIIQVMRKYRERLKMIFPRF